MSKFYAQWRRPRARERPWRVHPIWRGIGCLLLIIVPVISYVLADLLVKENLRQRWLAIPRELAGPASNPYLFSKILLAVVVAVVIFGVFTVLYSLIFSLAGPPRYGPYDSPPPKRRARPRSRR